MDTKKTKQIRTFFDQLESKDATFIDKQMYLAVQIQNYLNLKKWTQKRLADETGLRPSQISSILNGTSNPTLKTISRIEDALEKYVLVTPEYHEDESLSDDSFLTSEVDDLIFSLKEEEFFRGFSDQNFSHSFTQSKNAKSKISVNDIYLYPKAS